MEQRCEVCEHFRPKGDLKPGRLLVEVSFGSRRVLLCTGHAKIAENSEVSSFEELRALYAEHGGKRSYVPRRARNVARAASGEPLSIGRRTTDARS